MAPASWRAHVDGGCDPNPGGIMGIGVLLEGPAGTVVAELAESPEGAGTSNVAEFHAVLRALQEAKRRGAKRLEVVADSRLTVGTLNGRMRARAPHLVALLARVRQAEAELEEVRYRWVPRAQNADADRLATLGIETGKRRAGIPVRARAAPGAPPGVGAQKATGAPSAPGTRPAAEDWRCSACGQESRFTVQVFKNGTRHIRQECREHGFLRYAPNAEPYISLAQGT